ncbi:hypothetical protein [Sphingomonas sp. 1P08PE]|uniref:hypothetical protein n=1 Tax=Sphingomonas sp. 1P08PE TaxID=554122 RepID=UPI0039A1EEA4
MPDDQPSNAPYGAHPTAHNRDTAAAVLARTGQDNAPGGGTLIGSGDAEAPVTGGGATPNSPIDTGVESSGDPEAEARHRSLAEDTAAPR